MPAEHPPHTPASPSTSPADLASSSTLFASTGFEPLPQPQAAGPIGSTLDVCHVGVVLRVMLVVHAWIAVGVSFASASWPDAFELLVSAMTVSVPAALLWLVAACGLRRGVARLGEVMQRLAMMLLGALAALACGWPLHLMLGEIFPWARPAGLVLAGGAGALAVFEWLRLRARAMTPALAAARLAELQARIRPHFLFNTLNTAIALVRVDPARAEVVLEDLSELFRVALADAQTQVSLAQEVELARRYLEIEQIRFGQRLRIEWELDPAADAARLPPLVLQPLVENAVKHGVEPSPAGGLIRVRTKARRGQAQITVSNSLSGRPSEPGHGLATENVRERLLLMHDVAAQFDTAELDGAYHVRIRVPL